MTDDEKAALVWKVSLVLVTLYLTTSVAMFGWIFTKVYSHELVLAGINGSRCTDTECDRMRDDINRNTFRLDKIPTQIPPPDFKKKVDGHGERIAILEHLCEKKH